ncbi:hypothetical protein [Oceanobacillus sp. FSL H7-0719]|uniref:hypothetical protein n=1 Tax=Oceanobacillus sp. FSL H7-0719 TaxID=2954507 RepID=UPI0032437832
MEYNITFEKFKEVAERYGLKAEMSDRPGFYVGDKELNLDELFMDYYKFLNIEDRVADNIDVKINKEKSKIRFNHITNKFNAEEREVA